MNVRSQKKIAAKILKVGETKVYVNPEHAEEIEKAITRDDIRALIKEGSISKRKISSGSKGRVRKNLAQKKKGRRKGKGSKKGKIGSRTPKKEAWISKVRALRDELKKLKEKGDVADSEYRRLYRQIKGNLFQSRRHLREHIEKSKK